jgi:hypothetical protein
VNIFRRGWWLVADAGCWHLKGANIMDVNRWLRMVAGSFVLLSLALGYWVSPKWYFFTAFVGINLLQSAFTNWCPMMTFLRKLGVKP